MKTETVKTKTVTIIGLDRVSASIGMALRAAEMGLTLLGNDENRPQSELAKKIGAVDKLVGNPVSAAAAADILIINVPFVDQEKIFQLIGADVQDHALVVDMSELKGPGLKWAGEYMSQGHYVGASPVLAASALEDGRFGVEAAQPDLFKQSILCLMPSPKADPQAVETAVNLGRILGASPFFLDAYEYDSLMKGVDTAPGLLSVAMFRAVTKSSGWRDMLRFAGLRFGLSTASLEGANLASLAFQDKSASLRWIDAVLTELQEIRRWIVDGDEERLSLILEEVLLDRERWIYERAQNDWIESSSPDLSGMNMASQLFGFRPKKKDKDQR